MARKVLENEDLEQILALESHIYHKLLNCIEGKNEDFVGYNDACYLSDKLGDIIYEFVILYGQNILSDLLD